MSTQIKSVQFGNSWVMVRNLIFFVNKRSLEALRAWYENKLKVDPEAPEEALEDELEYLTKALALLRPRSREEAERDIEILEQAYVSTDYKVKELIDRLFEAQDD